MQISQKSISQKIDLRLRSKHGNNFQNQGYTCKAHFFKTLYFKMQKKQCAQNFLRSIFFLGSVIVFNLIIFYRVFSFRITLMIVLQLRQRIFPKDHIMWTYLFYLNELVYLQFCCPIRFFRQTMNLSRFECKIIENIFRLKPIAVPIKKNTPKNFWEHYFFYII